MLEFIKNFRCILKATDSNLVYGFTSYYPQDLDNVESIRWDYLADEYAILSFNNLYSLVENHEKIFENVSMKRVISYLKDQLLDMHYCRLS